MNCNPQLRVPLKNVQKRQVTVLKRLLKHTIEIADGLMIVEDEYQAEWMIHVAFAELSQLHVC